MKPFTAGLMFGLAWLSSDASPAAETPSALALNPITSAVRDYLRRGDAALVGHPAAVQERQELGRKISESFAAEPQSTWQIRENAADLLKFVLFGGPASVLGSAVAQGAIPKEYETTARGVIAFSNRDLDLARKYLIETAPDLLPHDVEEPLALVRGTLLAPVQPEKAMLHFRRVQLVAPGTALEEAALRQHVLVLVRNKNVSEGIAKLATYLRRFPASIYWLQFAGTVATGLVRADDLRIADLLSGSQELILAASKDRYHQFLLEVSKRLIVAGSFEKAAELSAYVGGNSDPLSRVGQIAYLYKNVCDAVTASSELALKNLRAVELSRYSKEEQDLVRAGIAIATEVQSGYRLNGEQPPPTASQQNAPAPDVVQAIQPIPVDLNDKVSAAMESAKEKLSEVQP